MFVFQNFKNFCASENTTPEKRCRLMMKKYGTRTDKPPEELMLGLAPYPYQARLCTERDPVVAMAGPVANRLTKAVLETKAIRKPGHNIGGGNVLRLAICPEGGRRLGLGGSSTIYVLLIHDQFLQSVYTGSLAPTGPTNHGLYSHIREWNWP